MRQPREWGTNLELQAIAESLNIRIKVYTLARDVILTNCLSARKTLPLKEIFKTPSGATYTNMQELGSGQFGRVYKSRDNNTKMKTAGKLIPKGLLENANLWAYLKDEFDGLKNVSHDNIVRFIETKEFNDYYIFRYEYCNGATLQKFLELSEKLKPQDYLKIKCLLLSG